MPLVKTNLPSAPTRIPQVEASSAAQRTIALAALETVAQHQEEDYLEVPAPVSAVGHLQHQEASQDLDSRVVSHQRLAPHRTNHCLDQVALVLQVLSVALERR